MFININRNRINVPYIDKDTRLKVSLKEIRHVNREEVINTLKEDEYCIFIKDDNKASYLNYVLSTYPNIFKDFFSHAVLRPLDGISIGGLVGEIYPCYYSHSDILVRRADNEEYALEVILKPEEQSEEELIKAKQIYKQLSLRVAAFVKCLNSQPKVFVSSDPIITTDHKFTQSVLVFYSPSVDSAADPSDTIKDGLISYHLGLEGKYVTLPISDIKDSKENIFDLSSTDLDRFNRYTLDVYPAYSNRVTYVNVHVFDVIDIDKLKDEFVIKRANFMTHIVDILMRYYHLALEELSSFRLNTVDITDNIDNEHFESFRFYPNTVYTFSEKRNDAVRILLHELQDEMIKDYVLVRVIDREGDNDKYYLIVSSEGRVFETRFNLFMIGRDDEVYDNIHEYKLVSSMNIEGHESVGFGIVMKDNKLIEPLLLRLLGIE